MGKNRSYIIILLAIHLVALSLFAAFRIIDADEGTYGNASRMMALGMAPYTDFFWSQLSMMPGIFAPFATDGWSSFYLLRYFAVLAGFLSAVLMMLIVYRITDNAGITAVILFMYTFSGMSLTWHTTFKALSFCSFLVIASFYFWLMFYHKKKLLYLIFHAMFLSALINFRSLFIVLLPAYLISICMIENSGRLRTALIFIISLIPISIPTFLNFIKSPDHFLYGNLFFQLTRDVNRSFDDIIYNRLVTFFRAIIDPHLLIILILTIFSIWLLIKKRKITRIKDIFVKPEGMIALNLILIAAVYLLPHPAARRYIDNYLPFALMLIAFNMSYFKLRLNERFGPSVKKAVLGGLAALYILSIIPYTAIFIYGVRERDQMYRLSDVKNVTHHMLEIADKSDTVLAEWPGYTFLTGQMPLRYTEIVAWDIGLPLKHADYMNYNLCDSVYLRSKIEEKTPKLVVVINEPLTYYASALEENYDRSYKSGDISVYKRR